MPLSFNKDEVLPQLCSFSLDKLKNAFPHRFSQPIKALEEPCLDNALAYFPPEDVKVLGDFGGAVARMFFGASEDRGRVIFDIFVFVFVVDDMLDRPAMLRSSESYKRLRGLIMKLVRNEPIKEEDYPEYTNLIKFSQPIYRTFQSLTTPTLFYRHAHHYSEYLDGVDWEIRNRSPENWVPTLDTFKYMRQFAGGTYPSIVLAEFAMGIEAPITIRRHPVIQRICSLASDLIVWDNDIFSLKKEVKDGVVYNIVIVLYVNGKLSTLQSAIDTAIQLRMESEREILELINNCPDFGEDNAIAKTYIDGIIGLISGNHEWGLTSTRYNVKHPLPAL